MKTVALRLFSCPFFTHLQIESSMNDTLQNLLALAGRILLALMFVMSGFGKIAGFGGTVGYM